MSINEILDITIEDTTLNVEVNGGGADIISSVVTKDLNKYAYISAFNSFRLSQLMSSLFFQMEDGLLDFYTDESYINILDSVNQERNNFFGTVYYYQPLLIGSVFQNMTLLSTAIVSNGISGGARIVILEEDVDNITINADLKVFVSRDNGITFTEAVLSKDGNFLNKFNVYTAIVDVSSQPEDLNFVYKICSYNNKNLKIYSCGLNWL